MTTIYLDFIDAPMWYHNKGLLQTATGYGSKLNTGKKALVGDKAYRVYATCFSNCASLYIIIKGVKIYVDNWK
jgi:hypothetical protein